MNNSRARRRNNSSVALVRATCPTCGDVELTVLDVQVQYCMTTASSTYSFVCPACRFIVNKEASDSIVESLTSAGARLLAWSMPAELNEPKTGPKISHDDLLEFHLALEGNAWEAELEALAAGGR